MRVSPLFVLAIIGFSACASSPASQAPRPSGPSASSTLITEQEIAKGSYANALEIVESLRPSMLRGRGTTMTADQPTGLSTNQMSSVNVVVFQDDVRLGEPSRLAGIPTVAVREIRFINGRDATTRWGTGVSSGVIQVITKR